MKCLLRAQQRASFYLCFAAWIAATCCSKAVDDGDTSCWRTCAGASSSRRPRSNAAHCLGAALHDQRRTDTPFNSGMPCSDVCGPSSMTLSRVWSRWSQLQQRARNTKRLANTALLRHPSRFGVGLSQAQCAVGHHRARFPQLRFAWAAWSFAARCQMHRRMMSRVFQKIHNDAFDASCLLAGFRAFAANATGAAGRARPHVIERRTSRARLHDLNSNVRSTVLCWVCWLLFHQKCCRRTLVTSQVAWRIPIIKGDVSAVRRCWCLWKSLSPHSVSVRRAFVQKLSRVTWGSFCSALWCFRAWNLSQCRLTGRRVESSQLALLRLVIFAWRASSCSPHCAASDGVLRNRSVSPEHDTDSVNLDSASLRVAESFTWRVAESVTQGTGGMSESAPLRPESWLDESPLHLAECVSWGSSSQQLEESVTLDGSSASMVDCAIQGSARLVTRDIPEEMTVMDTVMESSLWQDVGKILFRENAMHVRSLVRSMERCAERASVICWFFWRMLLSLRRQRCWAQQVQTQNSAWIACLAWTAWRLSVRRSVKPNNNDGFADRAHLPIPGYRAELRFFWVCWRGSRGSWRRVWQEEHARLAVGLHQKTVLSSSVVTASLRRRDRFLARQVWYLWRSAQQRQGVRWRTIPLLARSFMAWARETEQVTRRGNSRGRHFKVELSRRAVLLNSLEVASRFSSDWVPQKLASWTRTVLARHRSSRALQARSSCSGAPLTPQSAALSCASVAGTQHLGALEPQEPPVLASTVSQRSRPRLHLEQRAPTGSGAVPFRLACGAPLATPFTRCQAPLPSREIGGNAVRPVTTLLGHAASRCTGETASTPSVASSGAMSPSTSLQLTFGARGSANFGLGVPAIPPAIPNQSTRGRSPVRRSEAVEPCVGRATGSQSGVVRRHL